MDTILTQRKVTRSEALEANIAVHGRLAEMGEYNKSPHFLPENQAKVRGLLQELVASLTTSSNIRLLDFGCGTGFIIHLAHNLVDAIDGIDITQAMLDKVDTSLGNITLTLGEAEHTPYDENTFDLATAYSFMDHLYDYRLFLAEAYRVLKPGGILYVDLNPNRAFIEGLAVLVERGSQIDSTHVLKEIKGALHNADVYDETFGIDGQTLTNAEPGKSFDRGFDGDEVVAEAKRIGFSSFEVHHDWFFSEGVVLHQQSDEHAAIVDGYLRMLLPHTSMFYKYLRFVGRK